MPRGPWWFSQRRRELRRYSTLQGVILTKSQVMVEPLFAPSPRTAFNERRSLLLAPGGKEAAVPAQTATSASGSHRLRCENHHGPRGTHDILCSVPLTEGVGTQVEVSSPTGVY